MKNTVFLFESFNFVYIFFHFISTSYDAHLRTRRRQSSVLGKCRSVPPSIFVWFMPFQVFLIMNLMIRESSTQWESVHSETKTLCPMRNFILIFYIDNTLIWCHYETFETQRLISRSLACVELRNNGFHWAKVSENVPL